MARGDRMAAFEGAFERFLEAVGRIPEDRIGEAMDPVSPRKILVQLTEWNRMCGEACRSLRQGVSPGHFAGSGAEASRVEDALRRFQDQQRSSLVDEMLASKVELTGFLADLENHEWTADRGVRHPEGGPATIRRELERLTRRYLDATDEILHWLEPRDP